MVFVIPAKAGIHDKSLAGTSCRAGADWDEVMPTLRKPLITAAVLAFAAAGLSACGVKGPLEPPGGQAATASGEVRSPEAADAGPNSAAPKKKHDSFILDPLLR